MMRRATLVGVPSAILGLLCAQGAAWPNGTHKRRSTAELNATLTCAKKDKTSVKVEVLADDLKSFLVRAEGGETIVTQEVATISVVAIDKTRKTLTAEITYVKGGRESAKLKAAVVTGTDERQQDRRVVLAECKTLSVTPERGDQTASTDDPGPPGGRVYDMVPERHEKN